MTYSTLKLNFFKIAGMDMVKGPPVVYVYALLFTA